MTERDKILDRLSKNGFRITKQRKLMVDIILSNELYCVKEIYYKANQQDPTIGIATVYRFVNALENIGALDRRRMYKVEV